MKKNFLAGLIRYTLGVLKDERAFAVVNNYVSPNYLNANGIKLDPAGQFGPGTCAMSTIAVFAPASTDSVGSVYRVFKNIPSDVIITGIKILNDAWTNCTSIDIGLYQVLEYDGVGAVVSGQIAALVSAYNPSSGNPITSAPVSLPLNIAIANRLQPLWQIAGQAEYPPKFAAFDIALSTVTNTGSATPNIYLELSYIRVI